ncbi:HAD-IIIC family phosphatase [Vibrio diabolicus]|uniref:HAD-IIIC family phosphatase n=1 Tax=Vibrio diabolicus TaxID=50719 RepID=UPI003750D988
MNSKNKKKVKLVIWDLDETFWKGTLSEEGIVVIEKNIENIKKLSQNGIVNSICSKNNYEDAKNKLIELGVWEYFIFPHIDWSPKGVAVSRIIQKCQLRAENVVFIDDNLGNINEVEHFNPGITTLLPEEFSYDNPKIELSGKKDHSLSRLKQYKILEEKDDERTSLQLDNIEFLKQSDINLHFDYDVNKYIDRILELENRSNQLNFTKVRVNKDDLTKDIENHSAVIFVKDKYGDYGLVGFYCFNSDETSLKHFVFSCRILNMGVDNYVYNKLGKPNINVVNPVVQNVEEYLETIDYIIEKESKVETDNKKNGLKILLLGGCDLEAVAHYLSGGSEVVREFNYVNSSLLSVHKEHSELIKLGFKMQSGEVSIDVVNEALKSVPFLSSTDITSSTIYDGDWDVLVYSLLNDYSRGLYRHKTETEIKVPFELFTKDWTKDCIDEDLPMHLTSFTAGQRHLFAQEFEFIKGIKEEELKSNLSFLAGKFPDKQIILLNGAEVLAIDGDNDMLVRHVAMNKEVSNIVEQFENLKICDVREIITDINNLTDNIRHYQKDMYFKIAQNIISILKENVSADIKASRTAKYKDDLKKVFFKAKRKLGIEKNN